MQRYDVTTQHDPDISYGCMEPREHGAYVYVDDVIELMGPLLTLIQQKLDPYLLTADEELMLKALQVEWSS